MQTTVYDARSLPTVLSDWRSLGGRAQASVLPAGMLDGPLDADGVFIVGAWVADRLMGLWPLRVRRRGPLRIAMRAGRELQTYDGALLDPEADPAATAAALWSEVERRCPADVLLLRALPDASPLRRLPTIAAVAETSEETWWLQTDALSSPEAVIARLSKSRRKSSRRNRRGLEASGEVVFSRLRESSARVAAIRSALSLKAAWLDEQQLHSFAVHAPWFQRALTAAAAEPAMLEQLEVFTLSVGGEPVAFEVGFRDRSTYRSFVGAFSPAWSAHGVGAELTAQVLQWCVSAGIARCDLLPPSSDFKAGWCDHSAPVWSARLALSVWGRAALPLTEVPRRLKPLYLRLPTPTRDRLNKVLRGIG